VRLGGRAVLDHLSVALQPGKVTCIVGPNGAGKSTLLACLAGLLHPATGRALLDDQPLLAMAPRLRARRIGFLPQTPEIAWAVESQVLIALGRTPYAGRGAIAEEDRAAVARAMALTRTEALAERIVTTLSGGERGRVLIARALAGEPEWLLADEPLAGLDPGHQLDACALFEALAHEQDRGVVVTLHDLTLALRMADHVIVLADGKVLAQGGAEEALSPDILRRAYGVEAQVLHGAHGPLIELIGRRE
jgi:iron complex transport system ATP-binding protein